MKRTMLLVLAILGLCSVAAMLAYGQEMQDAEQDFAKRATIIHSSNIQLGSLAATQAFQKEVQVFGKFLALEHQKAQNAIGAIAKAQKWVLPGATDKIHQDFAKMLGEQKRADFDRMFLEHVVEEHRKALAFFENVPGTPKNEKFQRYIQDTKVSLKECLSKAQSLQKVKSAE